MGLKQAILRKGETSIRCTMCNERFDNSTDLLCLQPSISTYRDLESLKQAPRPPNILVACGDCMLAYDSVIFLKAKILRELQEKTPVLE